MKVLHASDRGIPDARIEKAAHTAKKKGWQTYFVGPGFETCALGKKIFDGFFHVSWNRYARLGIHPHYDWVKRRLKKVIGTVRPDVIHSHNIFSAKMVCEMGYPLIFDDHELYSLGKFSDAEWERSFIDKVIARYEALKWKKWECEVSEKTPVITVSNDIGKLYLERQSNTYVVPNYPSSLELSGVHIEEKRNKPFKAAYVGGDVSKVLRPFRDTSGIIDVFKSINMPFIVVGDDKLRSQGVIFSKGFVPHLMLYEILSGCHVGIVAWKKHWFHKYCNPNKPYLYAHSGMVVVVPSSLTNVITAFEGNCRTIEKISDLEVLLRGLSNDIEATIEEGQKTKEYASQNLIWELHEERILKAYEDAT